MLNGTENNNNNNNSGVVRQQRSSNDRRTPIVFERLKGTGAVPGATVTAPPPGIAGIARVAAAPAAAARGFVPRRLLDRAVRAPAASAFGFEEGSERSIEY